MFSPARISKIQPCPWRESYLVRHNYWLLYTIPFADTSLFIFAMSFSLLSCICPAQLASAIASVPLSACPIWLPSAKVWTIMFTSRCIQRDVFKRATTCYVSRIKIRGRVGSNYIQAHNYHGQLTFSTFRKVFKRFI